MCEYDETSAVGGPSAGKCSGIAADTANTTNRADTSGGNAGGGNGEGREERIDEIGFSGYRLIQRPAEFCYGIDAVLLADFARVREGGRVCDLGTGTGIIPLILRHKTEAAEIWGVELQAASWELAQRNAALNGLEDSVHFLRCDVKEAAEKLGKGTFDTVVSNPPYMAGGGGLLSRNPAKLAARHETTASLSDFVKTAAELLNGRGSFYLVHRPSRLADIVVSCRENRLEPKLLRLVAPREGAAPNILLLQCVKNGNPELTVLSQLNVYDRDGGYTQEILRIYERPSGQ